LETAQQTNTRLEALERTRREFERDDVSNQRLAGLGADGPLRALFGTRGTAGEMSRQLRRRYVVVLALALIALVALLTFAR
jgi:hypothetical protein